MDWSIYSETYFRVTESVFRWNYYPNRSGSDLKQRARWTPGDSSIPLEALWPDLGWSALLWYCWRGISLRLGITRPCGSRALWGYQKSYGKFFAGLVEVGKKLDIALALSTWCQSVICSIQNNVNYCWIHRVTLRYFRALHGVNFRIFELRQKVISNEIQEKFSFYFLA